MREARRLITYSSRTVREIAYDLGFEDDKYFSRLFKKTTGKSPGSYRKRT
ncbi:helix-turn-helix domain-containing protein [Mucilaginibacter myungsuensis]|nr:AraC family transcriptional regulator [Mucilaginibacter myungsuensis]MDN3598580.1 AraC family transcriptional regulator [Mucilaginibacter myungsuensis]